MTKEEILFEYKDREMVCSKVEYELFDTDYGKPFHSVNIRSIGDIYKVTDQPFQLLKDVEEFIPYSPKNVNEYNEIYKVIEKEILRIANET